MEPTIWTGLPDDAAAVAEEILWILFVAFVRLIRTDEVIELCSTRYPHGLAAAVGQKTPRAIRVSAGLSVEFAGEQLVSP